MNNPRRPNPVTRREFLRQTGGTLGFLAFSGFAPAFLARSAYADTPRAERDRSILVIIQLAGGNDGLNTVIPFQDDNYYRLRPSLALREPQLIRLNEETGLHPACDDLARLHHEGKLCIVQNVGYPNPNRSHFRSMEIWETATDSDRYAATGWMGRYLDNACAGQPVTEEPAAINLGQSLPQSFFASQPHNLFSAHGMRLGAGRRGARGAGDLALLEAMIQAPEDNPQAHYLQQTLMNTMVTERRVQGILENYQTPVNYPGNRLAQSLRQVAALIASGLETRLYFVSQGGYDTHVGQENPHSRLLTDLSSSMAAFQQDLESKRLQDQVLTMTFSEFGRRSAENASRGTDHGTAAPLFIMGSSVRQPFAGTPPVLPEDSRRDPDYSTDFRQVYATLLSDWLNTDATAVLGRPFDSLNILG